MAARRRYSHDERRLVSRLDAELAPPTEVLHDRSAPGARGSIGHVVIAPTGIWLVDAMDDTGRVRRRDVGGWRSSGERLFVGDHNRTKLVDAMGWQVAAVRAQLDDVGLGELPVHPVLCLTVATWGWFPKPFRIGGVLVTWPAALVTSVLRDRADRLLDDSTIDLLARHLGSALPASGATAR